ncbi:MAG TPA: permease prefix domain 1-containing protein, partial [Acidobacteriaceae bacterium]
MAFEWMGRTFRKAEMLFRRERFQQELAEEMTYHQEEAQKALEAEGLSAGEARQAAKRQFGNAGKLRGESEEVVAFRMESVWQDLRYAARQLWNSPGFTVIITLTLALSIGANSAIFSVVNAVLLKPLPYPEADRLVRVYLSNDVFPAFPLNPWDLYDYRARSHSFESMAGYTRGDVQLSGAGEPVRLNGFSVTSGYFHTLGLTPQLGREFDAKAEIPGNGAQVILSDR